MIKVTNIQVARIIGVLLILLSGDAFAVREYATQDGLDTEISNRTTADTAEVNNRNAAIAAETARATKAIATATARATKAEGTLKAADTAETARATKAEGTLKAAITTETARAKAAEAVVHMVGDSYQGGIIFWVEPDGQHGLIAAKADQNGGVGIKWYNGTYFATNATADGIYAGAKNTEVIISTQTNVGLACSQYTFGIYQYYCTLNSSTVPANTAPYAALVAANYSIQDDGVTSCTSSEYTPIPDSEICYGDWYLPSKVELNLLYKARNVVGGFAKTGYWSSTEGNSLSASFQKFTNGTHYNYPKHSTPSVRAVRAF